MRNVKNWLLGVAGLIGSETVHPGDVYLDWCEAEAENEEFTLLYG